MSKPRPRPPLLLLPNVAVSVLLGACSAYAAKADEDDPSSGINWISPEPNEVFISGDKMVATWSTSSRRIVSPSFQLCLVEMDECGDTVWPNVKKLPNGQYTISMRIPELGLDNEFFIRMEDDNGAVYDTPEFKLQAVSTNASSPDATSGSGPSSSGLPDSRASSDPPNSGSPSSSSTYSSSSSSGSPEVSPGSSGSGSGSSSAVSEEHDESKHESGNGNNESPMGIKGNGSKSSNSTTASPSAFGNGTLTAATIPTLSVAPIPSATSNALVRAAGDNRPSTVAIVVPLAIFAAALAGLIFSLRQRSKAKEARSQAQTQTQTQSNLGQGEPALKQVTTRDSTSSGSSGSSGTTDLERAMEFIARVKASESSRLTPLPPSIESKRQARRENRMRKAEESPGDEDECSERATIPASSSAPSLQQPVRQLHDGPPSDLGQASAPIVSQQNVSRPATYAIYQGPPAGLPHDPVIYQPPVGTLTYGLAPGARSHLTASQTVSAFPATSFSSADIPRPPAFVQQSLPASTSLPAMAAANLGAQYPLAPPAAPAPVSLPTPVSNLVQTGVPLPPVLPASLQVARPQAPMDFLPQTAAQSQAPCSQPEYMQHAQPRPQPEYNSAASSPTGPDIPYSTRPQPQVQVHGIPNPYDAIVKALRTPRLG